MILFFFFNDTATTEIYTLSLHDALPISKPHQSVLWPVSLPSRITTVFTALSARASSDRPSRSEEHTSELQSQSNLVCRLLLEKKKKIIRSSYLDTLHHRDPCTTPCPSAH